MKIKAFFKKIIGGIKKPFGFIKRKTEPAREFMRTGRAGGMIAELIVSALFMCWIIDSGTYGKVPLVINYILTVVLLALSAEVLNLVLKIVFGAGKRCKTYFCGALFTVLFNNLVGNQLKAVFPAIIMSFLFVLSVDIIGRCIWAFIKSRRFKQVFAYVAAVLSVIYAGFYIWFLKNDSFGQSRIDFYNQIPIESTASKEGFDSYLKNGPYEVLTISYGPGENEDIVTETIDFSVFDSVQNRGGLTGITDNFSDYDFAKTPIKGQIWYPVGRTDCPVFFMVHGNHDSSVPSYMGYAYLGEYLASNGYVVVSVDENIINELGEGNDKRAILLLENMKSVLKQNSTKESLIYGLIDEDKIAIGGHSRGGEMVATAYLFNDLDVYPEDGNYSFDYHFNITSIVAIAPVVDQYRPVDRSVRISDVNYLLIHGANDQDVSSMMGEKQYNNISFTDESDDFHLKASVYILGANHGQFNSLWGRYDMESVTNCYLNTNNFLNEGDQKLIARAYIRTFLDSTLGVDDTYASLLLDIASYRSYLPKTVYITNYCDSDFISLCSFDDTVDISDFENGVSVDCTGTETWTLVPYIRGDGREGEDYVLSISWKKESKPAVEVTFPSIDISIEGISFGVADMREDTEEFAEGLIYTVELMDENGNIVSTDSPVLVYPSLAVQLAKQDAIFGTYEYKHQLQQVNITPTMFEGNAEFDYSKVVYIRIAMDGSKDGELIINNIGYWIK
ncbi:MAG: hypothetical protein IJV15_05205 [Lachnospiraceae bacterium]|nr:hypothetical protein [Lachnospiraceae bacterium]